MKICVLGHLCIDNVIVDRNPHPPSLGGTAAFASIVCARLIAPDTVSVVSKVGPDFPEEFLALLRKASVDTRFISQVKRNSTRYLLEYFNDDRQLTLKSVCEPLAIDDFPPELYEAELCYLGPIAYELHPETIIELKQRAKGRIALDIQGIIRRRNPDGSLYFKSGPKIEEMLEYIDILKLDLKEAEVVTGASKMRDIVSFLSAFGINLALITKGQRGSAVYWDGKLLKMPAIILRHLYDATGAGDCFFSVFLVEFLKAHDVFHAMQFARKAASYLIGNPTGLRSFLEHGNIYEMIDEFIEKNQVK